jgi:hypothetical protein
MSRHVHKEQSVSVRKQSFLKKLIARIVSSAVPVDGGYVFDLRGRWRYEPPRQEEHPRVRPQKPDARFVALTRI